ncbi:MAG: hypothetical protein ABJH68_20710 [Ilumatobacter sp.]|uniref:hypothetical protein n=1 Tax=Ilumatobacter sp. TaxID=1967498 RepID=UPI003299009D
MRECVAEPSLGGFDLTAQVIGVDQRGGEFLGSSGDESFESLRQANRVEPSQLLPLDGETELRSGERKSLD